MIAKAWMDESYRNVLAAQGLEVPPRPEDLDDEQLDLLNQDLLSPDGEVTDEQVVVLFIDREEEQ
jgi:hypothetical protein